MIQWLHDVDKYYSSKSCYRKKSVSSVEKIRRNWRVLPQALYCVHGQYDHSLTQHIGFSKPSFYLPSQGQTARGISIANEMTIIDQKSENKKDERPQFHMAMLLVYAAIAASASLPSFAAFYRQEWTKSSSDDETTTRLHFLTSVKNRKRKYVLPRYRLNSDLNLNSSG